MIADVLESPEARRSVFPVSVEFYHEAARLGMIGEDVELLEGVIFKKMPKSPLHQYLVRKLQGILAALLPPGFFVDRESHLTCATSEPEPDVAVIAGAPEDYLLSHPTTAELVFEVAIHTQQRDRSKAVINAQAGVKEYWLIEPEAAQVILFKQPGPAGYLSSETFAADQTVVSTRFPAFSLRLADLAA